MLDAFLVEFFYVRFFSNLYFECACKNAGLMRPKLLGLMSALFAKEMAVLSLVSIASSSALSMVVFPTSSRFANW